MTRKTWTASSDVARAQRAGRTFRNRLALTTVLTAASFMGYGRQVEAACVAPPLSSSYSCSGASGAQAITANNAAVTTVAGFSVDTAVDNGITITGDGALSYIDTNASPITSTSDNGLNVRSTGDDGETKGSVTIATNGNIYGYEHGIYASNEGSGSIDIKVYGQITGLDGDGIYARNGYDTGNGVDLTITAGAQSVITSGRDGITAENYGSGKLEVIANGKVIADNDGIEAENSGIGTDLIVTTGAGSTITAGSDGIDAEHSGTGNLLITVNGKVTGGDRGIESDNDGNGYTSIFVGASGIVEGESAAINAESDGNQDIWITNDGIIRNVSGASDAIAIETYGGDTVLENNGTLTGVVRFNENDDDIGNFGLWNTAGGRNEFGWDTDEVYNRGTILAANDATVDETTEFLDLEEFDNDGGLISLADGGVGDILRMRGEIESEFEGPLEYDADNGYLAVDAVLGGGEAGESDILEIIGNVDEDSTTTIAVNVVGVAGGANMLGIPVVKVIDGDTGPDNFSLDGPVHAGLFAWDLRFDDEENWYELFTSGVGIGGYEMAAGLTGAQDIWHQTTGTLAQRQADLRPLLNGTQVTPVADFTEPVAPTAAGRVGPGFWFNAVGGWLDRDAETDGYTLDRKQSIYGGLAGFDFAAEGEGDTWLFGIFGGYLSSTLKFKETNSKWTYDGPTIGAYATYLNDAFYADMTVKADFLSIDIEQDDLGADDSDTDGINLGGRIDTGYKIGGGEGAFVEPQATLAVVNTDLDDAEVGGADVDFDSETSVKGRLGLKLGYDHTASNAMIFSSDLTASVWQEFNGSNNASIAAAGLGDFGVSDDTIETLGDISLGFSVTAQEGWSGFLRANYLFAEDFEAITGNAGLRYSW